MTDQLTRIKSALDDRYHIERELGAGGMANVYLAKDRKLRREVAIKVLRPELAAVLGVERFLREVDVTANLQHPNILPLHDSGQADGFLYYVMPYVDGESLRTKLTRDRQLGVEETIKITEGVAAALDYAHERGVVHRDIKPENILLHAGQAMVADFGIALAVTAAGGSRLTDAHLSLGTPEYMSPEQATGDRKLTAQSDIYSLGALIYEMLVGGPPHTGATTQAIITKIVSRTPDPITAGRPSVPEHMDAAVETALAKVPGDRFATATALISALTDPSYTRAHNPAYRTSREPSIWRGRGRVIAAAAVIVAAFVFGRTTGEKGAPATIARVTVDAPNLVPVWRGSIAVSPDGTKIAYTGGDSSATRLFLRPIDGSDPVPVAGTEDAVYPFFSPDGLWLGFLQLSPCVQTGDVCSQSVETELKKVRLDGGPSQVVARVNGFTGASWGVDETIVFTTGGAVHTVSSGGGEPQLRAEFTTEGTVIARPSALPDGKTVLVTQFDDARGASLAVASLVDGTVIGLDQPGMYPHYVRDGMVLFSHDDQVLAMRYDQRRMRLTGGTVVIAQGISATWSGQTGTVHLGVSANGRTVAYLNRPTDLTDLVLVGADGSVEVLPGPPRRYGPPRISPDGRHIAMRIGLPVRASAGDIWSYDIHLGGPVNRLTWDSSSVNPEWTPDGQQIAYASARQGDWDLYTMPAGGGTPTPLLVREGPQWRGLLTPDTRRVVFHEYWPDTRQDLLVATLGDSSSLLTLAGTPAIEVAPALSPDGLWLAYQSDLAGRLNVYLQAVDGSGTRVPVSPGGAREPRWARDGRELYYRNVAGDSLYAITFDPGNPPELGRPRLLLTGNFVTSPSHASYDVHPDGERFVFLRRRTNDNEGIHVVFNWFDHWQRPRQ